MVCIRCGSEDFCVVRTVRGVLATGKYSSKTDVREYKCLSCKKEYVVECSIALIPVYDPALLASRNVTIDEYVNVWLPVERRATPQTGLFAGISDE